MATIELDSMDVSADRRAFACPGFYRIVPAIDGGLCRIRVPLGAISPEQMRAVAHTAERDGNGIVEVTNRANIQIRGLRASAESGALDHLSACGLAPAERWSDDTRNVLVSPTAGDDPYELIDVRPLANALLERLTEDPRFAVLSPKFSIQIDGGGAVALGDHPHDIWLRAAEAADGQVAFECGLAGAIDGVNPSARFIEPADALDAVLALIELFIEEGIRARGIVRMRDLVSVLPREAVWAKAEQLLGRPIAKHVSLQARSQARTSRRAPLGVLGERVPGTVGIGAAPSLGRIDASQLNVLADVAERLGRGEIRLTPWRSVVVPGVPADAAAQVVAELEGAGLICDDAHPMAHLIACSGRTGCASALADVKADAERLGAALAGVNGIATVHLSGCAKSCAVPGTADFTLVACDGGGYDLYRRERGKGGRFGTQLAAAIDPADARRLIAEAIS